MANQDFILNIVTRFSSQGTSAIADSFRRELEAIANLNLTPKQSAQAVASTRVAGEQAAQQLPAAEAARLRDAMTRATKNLDQFASGFSAQVARGEAQGVTVPRTTPQAQQALAEGVRGPSAAIQQKIAEAANQLAGAYREAAQIVRRNTAPLLNAGGGGAGSTGGGLPGAPGAPKPGDDNSADRLWRQQSAARTAEALAQLPEYTQARIDTAKAGAGTRADVARGSRGDLDAVQAQAAAAYQQAVTAAAVNTERLRLLTANIDTDAKAMLESSVAERKYRDALNERVRKLQIEANGGTQIGPGGTLFQRAQATVRAVGTGQVQDPEKLQTGGQFLAQRAFTTVGFAASGAALYGAFDALKSAVTETEQLDQQFALLKQQFAALGQNNQFQSFRDQILGIARDTGVSASEVASVGFQLKGAFGDSAIAIENTRTAMELVRTTGLSINEVTNDLTATATAYGVSFERIGDKVTALERRYGVLATQSFASFGVMATTAKQAGLSFDQVGEMIGAVGRASGRSADAIGESFNRILPAIQGNAVQIQQIYQQALSGGQIGQGQFDSLTADLAKGQTGAALAQIVQDQRKMTATQQNALISALGGTREAQTVVPLFQSAGDIQKGLQGNDADALQQRFNSLAQTLQQRLARLGEEFRQIGVQLGNAGLLDALKVLAGGFLAVTAAVGEVARIFNEINLALGGIPSKILAVVLAVKLLQAAFGGLKNLGGSLSGIVGGQSRQVSNEVAKQVAVEAELNKQGYTSLSRTAPVAATVRTAPAAEAQAATRLFAVGGSGEAALVSAGERIQRPVSFAPSAATIQRGLATASTSFIESVQQSFASARTRVTTSLRTLGSINQNVVLPGRTGVQGEGVAAGGVNGGIALAGSAIAAASALTGLVATIHQVRSDLGTEGANIRNNLSKKSLSQLQADAPSYKDDWSTRLTADLHLTDNSVGDLHTQAVHQATSREFTNAMEKGYFSASGLTLDEQKKLLDDATKNRKGAQKRAQDLIAHLNDQQRSDVEAFAQQQGTQDVAAATGGQSEVDAIADAKVAYESGNTTFAQYLTDLDQHVQNLRNLAAQGSVEAAKNLGPVLQERNQVYQQLQQQQQQLLQQSNAYQAATPQQQFGMQQQIGRLTAPYVAPGSVATPSPRGPSVSTPVPGQNVPDYATPDAKSARLAQLQQIQQAGQQSFAAQAAQVNDPALLDQMAKTFSLTPAQMAEMQQLAQELGVKLFDTGPLQVSLAQVQAAAQNQFALQQANAQAAIAGMYNPAAIAAQNVQVGQEQMTAANAVANPDERARAQAQAQASINQAVRSQADAADHVAQSRIQLQQAVDAQDPVKVARDQIAAGNLALAQSRGDAAAANAARAQIVQGQQAATAAQKDVALARIDLVKAQHPEDALAQARADQQAADVAARYAVSTADQLKAQAQRLAADRSVEQALSAQADAQSALFESIAKSNADPVAAAQRQLQDAQRHLAEARSRGAGPEVILGLQSQLVDQQANVVQTNLNYQESLIQFDLDMNNITRAQAIDRYKLLLAVAGNPEQRRQLLQTIHQLQTASNSSDFQFNLPGDINLPTLYQARRAAQEGSRDGTGQSYAGGPGSLYGAQSVDARTVNIVLNANNAVDGQAAVQTIVDALNEAPRVGTQARLY